MPNNDSTANPPATKKTVSIQPWVYDSVVDIMNNSSAKTFEEALIVLLIRNPFLE